MCCREKIEYVDIFIGCNFWLIEDVATASARNHWRKIWKKNLYNKSDNWVARYSQAMGSGRIDESRLYTQVVLERRSLIYTPAGENRS